jgi:GT2 family glycosyltransferase
MKISVMITSRNRCADLRRTLEVLKEMEPPPYEVLITADGCVDETESMVHSVYPGCRFWSNQPGIGSVPSRDLMMREAKGELVLSLDDDSYPASKDFFSHVPLLFESHPEAAVITFPEAISDTPSYIGKTFVRQGYYVAAYPNSAAVMRRDIYMATAGFPAFFCHAYEEPDYALQCYGSGWAVWWEPTLEIRHHWSSANRNRLHTHHLNARNELWSVWLRCPWPWLPVVSLFRMARQFAYSCSQGWAWSVREPLWWLDSIRGIPDCIRNRRVIRWRRYFAWMRLARRPLYQVSELQGNFNE